MAPVFGAKTALLLGTDIDRPRAISATHHDLPYLKLKLGNLLLVACTLGLAWPWTTIRNIRFVTDRLTLVGIDNFDEIVQAYDGVPPMGEGLHGFLDTGFDLG